MLSDSEIYCKMCNIVDSSVDLTGANANFEAGEPEFAITSLLEAAFEAGKLTAKLIDTANQYYSSGPVPEMLNALDMLRAGA